MQRHSNPILYTSRYFNEDLLTSGEVVPIRASMHPPIIPLPYELDEGAWTIVPPWWSVFEPLLTYWGFLDRTGVEAIAAELAAISERHAGKPLALLDYEDMVKGDRSYRVVFASWWEQQTGQEVPELTGDGRRIHWSELPQAVRRAAKKPKGGPGDPRYAHDEHRADWPLCHEDIEKWMHSRYWQTARSKDNPHQYTLRAWGDDRMFQYVLLYLRENGSQEVFGGHLFTYLMADGFKLFPTWQAHDVAPLINRRGQEDQYQYSEEAGGYDLSQTLFDGRENA